MSWMALLKGQRTANPESGTTQHEKTSTYRGVEIVPRGGVCCEAAAELRGRRFLSDEIPKLPLDGCTKASCRCGYELFEDRRTGARRTSDEIYDIISERYGQNRRSPERTGRRASDKLRR